MTRVPRLLIAGTASGAGKTTVTLGLAALLRQKGLVVQPFKAGPDYIDSAYHTQAAGRPCRNLDAWLVPSGSLNAILTGAAQGADLSLVEGMMGLFDGIGPTGEEASTAELAKKLALPVLLVVDAGSFSRSAAALVRGFRDFDRKVKIAGCFLNRVSSEAHALLVKRGIETLAGVPVVGFLPQDGRLRLPERHLGLVPSVEQKGWQRILALLVKQMEHSVDAEALLRLARRAPPLEAAAILGSLRGAGQRLATKQSQGLLRPFGARNDMRRVPIAVARDEAFHFYYPENLELLEKFGAEMVPFSPLKDRSLPRGAAGLYLGGGFPEVFAEPLSRNASLHREIREKAAAGLPTYAECGGLMYLSRSIRSTKRRSFSMVGLVPAEIRMTDRLQHFGYKKLRACRTTVLARAGEKARGHEFHHSQAVGIPVEERAPYEARSAGGEGRRLEGYAYGSLLASYVHLHFMSQPAWAKRLVEAARRWSGVLLFLTAYSLQLIAVSFAEEPTRLEEVVVTATKAKTPAKEVTRAVSVIPAERLSVVKGGFVSQGLSDVPETLVRRTGSIGRTTAVVIRGASATQVHVTVDGAHVASPTTGSFDFNHFTPDNLERIEILRGPGSTLYGADAMGGVINLVTRRGEGPFTFSATSEYGTLLDTFREAASMQGASGPWHLSASSSRMDANGLSQNDDYQNLNLSTRIGYDLPNQATADLTLRHIWAVVGVDDGPFRPDTNRRDRERQTIGTVRLEAPVTAWWSQTWRFSTAISNFIDNDPSNGGTQTDSLFKLDTERYGAEWMNRFTPVSWDALTVGLEFEDREADNRSFSKTQVTRAAYLQNQWRPVDPLTVVAGFRFFRESAFGSDQVFDLSAAYFHEPWGLKARGGYGQGFRPPTLNELFFPGFGVPNLSPEKSETWEMGFDQVLWDNRINWSGTLFRTEYEDLIQTVRVSSTVSAPQNVGKSRIRGAELELELKPWDPWTLTGSYTHLEANEDPSDEELLRVPKNTVGFSAGFAPSKRWDARLEGLLVSSREESTGTNSRNKTKGYLKLDALLQYRFKPWLRGHLRVDNLTDRQYAEVLGFPAEGLAASVGLTVER